METKILCPLPPRVLGTGASAVKPLRAALASLVLAGLSVLSVACEEDETPSCPEGQTFGPDGDCIRDVPLFIEVVRPRAGTSTTSSVLAVEGIASANSAKIRFLNASTSESGEIPGSTLWRMQVPLQPGDNEIVFTALKGSRTASVSLFTVLSTELVFFNQPTSDPAILLEGQPQPLRVVWGISPAQPGVSITGVELVFDGLATSIPLVDNGQLPIDEIEADSLYSGIIDRGTVSTVTNMGTGSLWVRARVSYTNGSQGGAVLSPPFEVEVRRPMTGNDLDTLARIRTAVAEASQALEADASSLGTVLDALEARLLELPDVREVKRIPQSYTMEIRLESGLRTTIMLSVEGARGGGASAPFHRELGRYMAALDASDERVEARGVISLSPYLCEFGETDEGDEVAALYEEQSCPSYEVEYLANEAVTVDVLRTLPRYGVIHIATHGEADARTNWIVLRERLTSNSLTRYAADLAFDPRTGEADLESVTLFDRCNNNAPFTTFRVNPSFFRKLSRNQTFPNSLVFMSACRSTFNGALGAAFLASGAKSFQGFSEYVDSSFAYERATAFHEEFRLARELDLEIFTPGLNDSTLLERISQLLGLSSATSAEWEMVSSGVGAPEAGLLNGDFEESALSGWVVDGDGRRLPNLGPETPRSGQFLGLISTGLGFTQEATIISQDICVEETTQRLKLSRSFLSEEFLEFCGSEFQDFFRVALEQDGQTYELVRQSIDDLCDQVTPVNLVFDQGDVSTTGWQDFDLALPADLDKTAAFTLILQCGDVGDSIYDSAIVLDRVRFE